MSFWPWWKSNDAKHDRAETALKKVDEAALHLKRAAKAIDESRAALLGEELLPHWPEKKAQ